MFSHTHPSHDSMAGFLPSSSVILYLFPLIFKRRYSPRKTSWTALSCLILLLFLYALTFYSSPATKLLCFFFSFDFLLLAISSSSSSSLTFVLLFLFASLSSSQLMTTNTQMVSLSLSLCHLSLVSVSSLVPSHSLIPNHPPPIAVHLMCSPQCLL